MTGQPRHSRWFVIERPANRWDVVGVHLPGALISGVILIASAVLPSRGLPGPICFFLRVTGLPCPFCGSTRTFIAMGHGHFHDAMIQSPFAAALFVVVAVVFLWNATPLLAGFTIKSGDALNLSKQSRYWLAGALIVALTANWLYRIFSGLR